MCVRTTKTALRSAAGIHPLCVITSVTLSVISRESVIVTSLGMRLGLLKRKQHAMACMRINPVGSNTNRKCAVASRNHNRIFGRILYCWRLLQF